MNTCPQLKDGYCERFKCPQPRPFVCERCQTVWQKKKPRGLGDVVHDLLAPAVKVIDKTLGTNLKGCGGCKKRREKLNTFGENLWHTEN